MPFAIVGDRDIGFNDDDKCVGTHDAWVSSCFVVHFWLWGRMDGHLALALQQDRYDSSDDGEPATARVRET